MMRINDVSTVYRNITSTQPGNVVPSFLPQADAEGAAPEAWRQESSLTS